MSKTNREQRDERLDINVMELERLNLIARSLTLPPKAPLRRPPVIALQVLREQAARVLAGVERDRRSGYGRRATDWGH
jgi:hypothetical protein